jgi:hypothetical protein
LFNKLRALFFGSLLIASTASADVTDLNAALDTSKLPKEVVVKGSPKSGLSWKDNNGDNYVVFSVTEKKDIKSGATSVYLYADHYAIKAGKAKLLRSVKDMTEKCEFDNMAAFIPESFAVTDVDKDNLGEVSFAYTLDCVSDVSPITLKVLLIENKDKYIIRGQTEVNPGDGVIGGKKEPDAALKKASKELQAQADAIWQKVVRR